MRNKNNGNKFYIDFELLLFLMPFVLIGSMIGCLAFMMFPPIFSYCLIMAVMIILSVRNFYKMKRILKERKDHLSLKAKSEQDSIKNQSSKTLKKAEEPLPIIIEVSKLGSSYNTSEDAYNNTLSEEANEKNTGTETITIEDKSNRKRRSIILSKKDSNSVKNMETGSIETALVEEDKDEYPSSLKLLWNDKFTISLIILSICIMVLANLLKGTKDRPSILNLPYCSSLSVVLYILCLFPLTLIGIYGYRKLTTREITCETNQSNKMTRLLALKIGIASVFGGFISTVGVSGSLFISAALILLNIEPIVVKCTLSMLILFLSSINSLQFFLMGYFDWRNILFLGCSALVGCLVANFVIKNQLAKGDTHTVNSIIAVQCFVMTLAICFAIPSSSYFEYLTNANFFRMGTIC
jgi:uncharacterized membrane protein YfcA